MRDGGVAAPPLVHRRLVCHPPRLGSEGPSLAPTRRAPRLRAEKSGGAAKRRGRPRDGFHTEPLLRDSLLDEDSSPWPYHPSQGASRVDAPGAEEILELFIRGEEARRHGDDKLTAFCTQFDLKCDAAEMGKVLGNQRCAAWNRGWKAQHAIERAIPDEWKAAGATAEMWAEVSQAKKARRDARRLFQGKVTDAAMRYKQKVKVAADVLKVQLDLLDLQELAGTDSELMRAFELGYDNLSLQDKLEIERAKENRAVVLAAKVKAKVQTDAFGQYALKHPRVN